MRQFILAAGLAVALAGGAARAEDVALKPKTFTDLPSGKIAVGKFSWFCANYEGGRWMHVYNGTYWSIANRFKPTVAYFHDFDRDGLEDAIVTFRFRWCGTASLECAHIFLFGDQPAIAGTYSYNIDSDGPPIFTNRNGIDGIIFDPDHTNFYSISTIKENTLSWPITSMEK
jgi:hypothetical protein